MGHLWKRLISRFHNLRYREERELSSHKRPFLSAEETLSEGLADNGIYEFARPPVDGKGPEAETVPASLSLEDRVALEIGRKVLNRPTLRESLQQPL